MPRLQELLGTTSTLGEFSQHSTFGFPEVTTTSVLGGGRCLGSKRTKIVQFGLESGFGHLVKAFTFSHGSSVSVGGQQFSQGAVPCFQYS